VKKIIANLTRRFVKDEWGGVETAVIETSKEFKKLNYQPIIFTSTIFSNIQKEKIFGIDTERFKYSYTRLFLKKSNRALLDKRGGDLYSIPMFLKLLFQKNIYIFHLHTINRVGAMVRIISKIRKIPYIITIHGGILDMPKEHLEELSQPNRGSFNWGKPIDILIGKNRVFDDSSAIICVSKKEQELMQKKYPNKIIKHIPNGVDLNKFNNGNKERFYKDFNLSENNKVILSVGSFHPLKNQMLLIESFLDLEKTGKKDILYQNITLVLVGVIYNEAYYNSLLEKAKLSKNIIILPNLDFNSDRLKDVYKSANIFVLPTKYDAFGIVVLEAWTEKIPSIVSKIGGLLSFVKDKENGIFFDLTKDDLTNKIKLLLNDKELYKNISQNCYQDVQKYSWKNITAQIENIFNKIKN